MGKYKNIIIKYSDFNNIADYYKKHYYDIWTKLYSLEIEYFGNYVLLSENEKEIEYHLKWNFDISVERYREFCEEHEKIINNYEKEKKNGKKF